MKVLHKRKKTGIEGGEGENIIVPRELKSFVMSHNKLREKMSQSRIDLSAVVVHARHNCTCTTAANTSMIGRCSEPQSEAVAELMGLSMADCRTNTGMAIAP